MTSTARFPARITSGTARSLLERLHHPEVVPRRVADPGVDAVRLLRRLLRELDAALLELLVARPAVVGREEEAARSALREQRMDLVPGFLFEHRRAGDRHQGDRDVLAGYADAEPPEVPHLGDGHVLAELHPQLLCVESGASSWSVTQICACVNCLSMSSSVVVERSAATLALPRGAVFSKPAGLRARVGLQHAGLD